MRLTRHWTSAAVATVLVATLTPLTAATSTAAPSRPGTGIPPEPTPSSLGLVLEEVAQLPKTEPTPAPTDARLMRHARINHVGELPDRSGRLYVPDLNGPLYLLEDGEPQVYLDLKARFPDFFSGRGMGSGFGFAAFHPEFAKNGRFYTVHSEDQDAIASKEPTYPNQPDAFVQSVVTEWTADDPAADTFTGTSREIFRFGFTQQIHAIQQIDFNPTARKRDADYGLLYLAVGDGGLGVSTDVPQDLSTPAGKILRIDPQGTDGPNGQYGIPRDNPWVGEPGALGETWAIGLRDPHRFSWDAGGKHRMFLGHIGQRAIEAIYEVDAGDDFGWPDIEGRLSYQNDTQCRLDPMTREQARKGYDYPVASYTHDTPPNWSCNADSGHAVAGGLVYRGGLKALRGKYVFGDLVEGKVFYTEEREMRDRSRREAEVHELQLYDTDGTRRRMPELAGDGRTDLRFGTDAAQNLYLLSKANGTIWRVVDTVRERPRDDVGPALRRHLVAAYDFEHPFAANDAKEEDQGLSRTLIDLIGGGEAMRVPDGAHPGSNRSLQLGPADAAAGRTAWKAGVYEADADGAQSLAAFNGAKEATIAGWFKMTGDNPSPGYNAVGLAGILSGTSDGHGVRALLEVINVGGVPKLVALGRRLDEGASQTFAAEQDWRELLPAGEWVHLAATFDYARGEMALYRNGKPVRGSYTTPGDPWEVDGTGTSATNPRGIKIGGSFPQDTSERNPCDCRTDSLMFFDEELGRGDVAQLYRRSVRR